MEEYEISLVTFGINIVCIYGSGGLSILATHFTGAFRRGFFCDDDDIRYKYHYNTIPNEMLYSISIGLGAVFILACELYVWRLEARRSRLIYRWQHFRIPNYIVNFLVYFGFFQLGYAVITKYAIGRLRPHFLDVCKPANYTCKSEHDYIIDYVCSGDDQYRIDEARLSFFSGHSSFGMYTALFIILYLQSRLGGRLKIHALLPFTQTAIMVLAMLNCYARISTNWHHWSDVLCGAIVGSLIAIYTAVFWAGLFSPRCRYIYDPLEVIVVPDELSQSSRTTGTTVYDEEQRLTTSLENQPDE